MEKKNQHFNESDQNKFLAVKRLHQFKCHELVTLGKFGVEIESTEFK